jgi:hypothetical protein
MSDVTFRVVDDGLRTEARPRALAPWIALVIDGNTVEVGMPQAKLGGYYKTFANLGYKLRTRTAGPDATVVWAESLLEAPKKGK